MSRRSTSRSAAAAGAAATRAPSAALEARREAQDAPQGLSVVLPPELVDAVAVRVAGLLRAEQRHRDQWLRVDEAAAYLRCPKSRIYRLVSMRRIPFQKDGARLLFSRQELDEWVRQGGAR